MQEANGSRRAGEYLPGSRHMASLGPEAAECPARDYHSMVYDTPTAKAPLTFLSDPPAAALRAVGDLCLGPYYCERSCSSEWLSGLRTDRDTRRNLLHREAYQRDTDNSLGLFHV